MHHWIVVAIIAYTVALGLWMAGVWDERDQLRKENQKLRQRLAEQQPWRFDVEATRRILPDIAPPK